MALPRLTYGTKTNPKPIVDRLKQATAEDFNEIKTSINAVADELENTEGFNISKGIATTPNNTASWFKIGKIDSRGGGVILLSFTGGNYNPTTYRIKYYKDWVSSGTLILEKYALNNYLTRVRIRQDSTDNKYYIEIYCSSNSKGLSFSVYHQKNLGYNSTGEVFTGPLQIGSVSGTTILDTPFTNGMSVSNLEVPGIVKCATLIETSDKKFKTNIEPINGAWALDVFKKLNFSFYDFSKTNSKQAGLIAQEVEKTLPQAVHTSENGEKGLNHTYIDMICKAAIQHFIKTQIQ